MRHRIKTILKFFLISCVLSGMPHSVSALSPSKTNASSKSKPRTSAEAKKKQEETKKEIKLTEEQLRQNELEVKKQLSELGKLDGDIAETKKKISDLNRKLQGLSVQINNLENNIAKNESELSRLREEYLKAVKKMRVAKKNKSDLAFVFASENFNQALRRLRYLREFSNWREKETAAINTKISRLKSEKESLAQAREEQEIALSQQKTNETKLQSQHSRQEEMVAELRKNGAALDSHLKKKQAEANELGDMISQLIAQEEQQRREEERRRKEEEERRLAEERRQAEERERELQLAQTSQISGQDKSGNSDNDEEAVLASTAKGKKKNNDKKKEEQKSNDKRTRRGKDKKEQAATIESGEKPKEYADARKRTPRSSEQGKQDFKSSENFADMKGKLPNPTNGSFKVTSRFGRQTLPDLPDVVYDNPGIDAESTAGASAQAVFKGKVSGVYLLPGYNTVVIVNHDGYYTVYGNISTSTVKVGDSVVEGQSLGSLALNEEDVSHSSLHFEVWKNREKLNPLEWLR